MKYTEVNGMTKEAVSLKSILGLGQKAWNGARGLFSRGVEAAAPRARQAAQAAQNTARSGAAGIKNRVTTSQPYLPGMEPTLVDRLKGAPAAAKSFVKKHPTATAATAAGAGGLALGGAFSGSPDETTPAAGSARKVPAVAPDGEGAGIGDWIDPGSVGGLLAGSTLGALLPDKDMSPARRLGLMLLLGGGGALGGHFLWDANKDKFPETAQKWDDFKSSFQAQKK